MNDNPFLALFQDIKKAAEAKRYVFATVSSVSSSGVSIRIDGETSGSAKNYTCNTDVKFSVGDRVMALKESGTYVIVCKIGKPGGPETKTAAMTQPVGVDANGKLWTTPASEQKIMTGTNVTMGGSELYHIVCNTSLELRPNSTLASHPAYLGTSSYYWHYAYIGSNTVSIGSSSTSKLGFFGTSPIARQTLSTSSNNMNYSSATSSNYLTVLNNLVGILKNKYGLIA